jgi:hypothetical protein
MIKEQMKYFAKLKALAEREKQRRGNIRDFELTFIAEAKFASLKANYFLPNSEAFDETLFIRLRH